MSTPIAPARLSDWLTAQPREPRDRSASANQVLLPAAVATTGKTSLAARSGGIFLPADRTERPLQHAADADRVGAEMKADRALVQGALGLRRTVTLAQIIEPGRAVVALGP